MTLRPATEADHDAIHAIVTAAFGREDEARIVDGVRAEGAALVDRVAEEGGQIIGHVLFSRMRAPAGRFIAGLGPVAVAPDRQDSGAGSLLCRDGVEACRALGCEAIVVLGHPTYYPRFGFSTEAAAKVISPYAGRPAFMAIELRSGALAAPVKIDYPHAFG